MSDRAQLTHIEPVMNKVNALFADDRVRQLLSASRSSFDLREVMDDGRILIIKLERGRMHDAADLVGSLLLAKIKMAAFSRTDIPESRRRPRTLYGS